MKSDIYPVCGEIVYDEDIFVVRKNYNDNLFYILTCDNEPVDGGYKSIKDCEERIGEEYVVGEYQIVYDEYGYYIHDDSGNYILDESGNELIFNRLDDAQAYIRSVLSDNFS